MTTITASMPGTAVRRRKGGGSGRSSSRGILLCFATGCLLVIAVLVLSLVISVPDDNVAIAADDSSGAGDLAKNNEVAAAAGATTADGGQSHSSIQELFHSYNISSIRTGLSRAVQTERKQLQRALKHLNQGGLPPRLQNLRDRHAVVGERLSEIQDGIETVEEVLHGHNQKIPRNGGDPNEQHQQHQARDEEPPMEMNEILKYLEDWIQSMHETLQEHKHAGYEGIWQAYHDLVVKTLYPWDQEYLRRMPKRRDDGSIFLSIATYRDENCFNTVYQAFKKAKNPDKLFVGIVQQNCHHDCKSGVLADLSKKDVPPDDDCEAKFCETEMGKPICDNKQVRVLNIDESDSLGPYAARYFASKLWYGENWFMQTDAHMTFRMHWDSMSVEMLNKAPSKKPIISHYPPAHTINLETLNPKVPAARICGPVFTSDTISAQIIRLEGGGQDRERQEYPAFAPFTAAGYFCAHADFLSEVPFDPFLPWIFMGEEIIMSTRLWTAGYDIFSPTEPVVGHIYVRR